MKIYLDDVRDIPNGYAGARTYEAFQSLIERCIECGEVIEEISFDHDLGDETEYSGFDALKWVISQEEERRINLSNTSIVFHTANPIGFANMTSLWKTYLKITKNV